VLENLLFGLFYFPLLRITSTLISYEFSVRLRGSNAWAEHAQKDSEKIRVQSGACTEVTVLCCVK
jgi:hypothetical protein